MALADSQHHTSIINSPTINQCGIIIYYYYCPAKFPDDLCPTLHAAVTNKNRMFEVTKQTCALHKLSSLSPCTAQIENEVRCLQIPH
jgi:hypothetical protein